jgi:hypothetical protein
MDQGGIPEQPLRPLSHAVMGALDEAALYVARSADPSSAGQEARAVIDRLIAGLTRA